MLFDVAKEMEEMFKKTKFASIREIYKSEHIKMKKIIKKYRKLEFMINQEEKGNKRKLKFFKCLLF